MYQRISRFDSAKIVGGMSVTDLQLNCSKAEILNKVFIIKPLQPCCETFLHLPTTWCD